VQFIKISKHRNSAKSRRITEITQTNNFAAIKQQNAKKLQFILMLAET